MAALHTLLDEASIQLDNILELGARHLLLSLTKEGLSKVNAALAFEETSAAGDLVQFLGDKSSLQSSTATCSDFPVLVNKSLVKAVGRYYAQQYSRTATLQDGDTQHKASKNVEPHDSLDTLPHITRTLLGLESPAAVALSWLCNPQLDCFVCVRRRWLKQNVTNRVLLASPCHLQKAVLKELLLLHLMLSVAPKLQSLWVYKLWLVQLLVECNCISGAPATDPLLLRVDLFQQQDDVVFFAAAQKHPLNYNAWHYRRAVLQLLYSASNRCGNIVKSYMGFIQCECAKVIAFHELHNGDSSASSYLLFLLREAGNVLDEPSFNAVESDSESEQASIRSASEQLSPSNGVLPPLAGLARLWKCLMCFTQREIRRHCEKGHECVWYLRLQLIQWACANAARVPLLSSWTVEDELRWVMTYVDAVLSDQLLAPVSVLRHAWTDSFGSLAWTSYNAARYGLQLGRLLESDTKSKQTIRKRAILVNRKRTTCWELKCSSRASR